MAVPRRRHCPSRRDCGRAHFYKNAPALAKCENCGAPARPHRVCEACGSYKGRTYKVIVRS